MIKNTKILLLAISLVICTAVLALPANPSYITKSDAYHIVKKGDTLYSISKKHDINIDRLKLFNKINNNRIFIGQKIYLSPQKSSKSDFITRRDIPKNGYHLVQRGQTVYRIAKMYGLEISDIVEQNELESFSIKTGQKIWLKKRAVVVKKPRIAKHVVARGEHLTMIAKKYGMSVKELKKLNNLKSNKLLIGKSLKISCKIINSKDKKIIKSSNKRFGKLMVASPLHGKMLSPFGMRSGRMHKGIDIGANMGEPILAALDGKVVFEGQQRGYGNVVILEHSGSVMTVYAHNESHLVRLGDKVKTGQPIATVGQSGTASCPHVHFEYRIKGKAKNPALYIKS